MRTPACTTRTVIGDPDIDLTPGTIVHTIVDQAGCAEFMVIGLDADGPLGFKRWTVMELGEPRVEHAQPPFSGVVLHLNERMAGNFHRPD